MSDIFVGIDVGAPTEGYHAIALRGTRRLAKFHSADPHPVACWCREQAARVVAVDAPCRWRSNGAAARAAERQLAAARISCFSTPTEEKARGHAFYTWMIAGAELYTALSDFPLYSGAPPPGRVCFETFPQAVACALAGKKVSAKGKRVIRTELVQRAGLDPSNLASIDEVDAVLCALTAAAFAAGRYKAYGDVTGGFIIVPSDALRSPAGSNEVRLLPTD